jgi:hypothetical protein
VACPSALQTEVSGMPWPSLVGVMACHYCLGEGPWLSIIPCASIFIYHILVKNKNQLFFIFLHVNRNFLCIDLVLIKKFITCNSSNLDLHSFWDKDLVQMTARDPITVILGLILYFSHFHGQYYPSKNTDRK